MLSAVNTSKVPRRVPNSPSLSTNSLLSDSSSNQNSQSNLFDTNNSNSNVNAGGRDRVKKRDNLIRAKANKDLHNKKKAAGGVVFVGGRKAKPGTVLYMKPNPPLRVLDDVNILQVAQVMAANRADAVLVCSSAGEEDENTLRGIITDKDLAFRVVAENLDVRSTKVTQIMTP